MSRGPDVVARFERAFLKIAHAAGFAISIDDLRSTPWASALFVGEQIRFTIEGAEEDAFEDWLADLPEMHFDLRNCLVADIVMRSAVGAATRREVLALLIEDRDFGR